MTTDNDISKRRRVLQVTHELADLSTEVGERYAELRDQLGVAPHEIAALVMEHHDPVIRLELEAVTESFVGMAEMALRFASIGKLPASERDGARAALLSGFALGLAGEAGAAGDHGLAGHMTSIAKRLDADPQYQSCRMERLINRMFAEAPKVNGQDAPALECQVIMRANGAAFAGALSRTPEGTLKMMVPTNVEGTFGEMFFDYDSILTVMFKREMSMSPAPIITPRSRY